MGIGRVFQHLRHRARIATIEIHRARGKATKEMTSSRGTHTPNAQLQAPRRGWDARGKNEEAHVLSQGLELELDVLHAVGESEHLLEAVSPRLRSKPREGAVRGRAGGGEDAGGSLLHARSKEGVKRAGRRTEGSPSKEGGRPARAAGGRLGRAGGHA